MHNSKLCKSESVCIYKNKNSMENDTTTNVGDYDQFYNSKLFYFLQRNWRITRKILHMLHKLHLSIHCVTFFFRHLILCENISCVKILVPDHSYVVWRWLLVHHDFVIDNHSRAMDGCFRAEIFSHKLRFWLKLISYGIMRSYAVTSGKVTYPSATIYQSKTHNILEDPSLPRTPSSRWQFPMRMDKRIFKKSRSHPKIRGAIRVTWSRMYTRDPNLIATANWRLRLMHPCYRYF